MPPEQVEFDKFLTARIKITSGFFNTGKRPVIVTDMTTDEAEDYGDVEGDSLWSYMASSAEAP